MRVTITTFITVLALAVSRARLIEKSTPPAAESTVTRSNSTHRIIRQTNDKNDEDDTESKEEIIDDMYDIMTKSNRMVRSQPRESSTHKKITVRNPKDKTYLVKEPIPGFDGNDYAESYLGINLLGPSKIADSMEVEDEDFSVDDYDFDVNHDEFVGRGKPHQPRLKPVEIVERFDTSASQKGQQKSNFFRGELRVQREAKHDKQPVITKTLTSTHTPPSTRIKDEYDEEFTSSPVPKKQRQIDEDSGDSEQSQEQRPNGFMTRHIRSPMKPQDLMRSILLTQEFEPVFPSSPGCPQGQSCSNSECCKQHHLNRLDTFDNNFNRPYLLPY